jgi:hypothetical protein
VSIELLKLANKLDEEKKYNKADSITQYLVNLSKSKNLKSSPELKNDVATKLLMLEKAGVDTAEFFEKLNHSDLNDKDLQSINQKLEVNCPGKDVSAKNTDLHEYVLWMNKEKDYPEDTSKEESEKYLDTLREDFLDFLTDVVAKDFKTEKSDQDLTSDNLIQFYFENRDKYESELDNYDLMLGQTEGIMSDDEFNDDLEGELSSSEPGPIVRHAE